MKVVDIKPFSDPVVGKVLGRPLFRDAINSMGDIVVWTFTEILTDEGITGITPYRISPEMLALLKPAVVGEDPLNIQRIWDQMYWRCFNMGRKGLPIIAMSHIDIGLWDIIGKKLKTPVYKLLGGFRDRVPGYGSGGGISLSQEPDIRVLPNSPKIFNHHLISRADSLHVPLIQPDDSIAQAAHRIQRMRHKQDGGSLFSHLRDTLQALGLKRLVAHRKDLVDQ